LASRTQISVLGLGLGLECPGLGLDLECPGLGLRILTLTTAFLIDISLYIFNFGNFAVGQTTNLIFGAPKFF